jgi:hypothetical protein
MILSNKREVFIMELFILLDFLGFIAWLIYLDNANRITAEILKSQISAPILTEEECEEVSKKLQEIADKSIIDEVKDEKEMVKKMIEDISE